MALGEHFKLDRMGVTALRHRNVLALDYISGTGGFPLNYSNEKCMNIVLNNAWLLDEVHILCRCCDLGACVECVADKLCDTPIGPNQVEGWATPVPGAPLANQRYYFYRHIHR